MSDARPDDAAFDPHERAAATAMVAANLAALRARIDAVRRPIDTPVTIVAVTKGHGPLSVAACLDNGLTLIGENYADELVEKASHPALAAARWTFQGHLQSNKINRLKPYVTLWQSVDSAAHIEALSKRVPGAEVLIQLNLTGAPGRAGAPLDTAPQLIVAARAAGLAVRGVMGVGPDPDDDGWEPDHSRRLFAQGVDLAERHDLPVRSFGMTSDLEYALEAGATMVRIGTALVGAR